METFWWSGVAVECLDWSVGRVEPLPLKGGLPCIWRNPGNMVVSSKCVCSIFEFSWWWPSHFTYISCGRAESFISSKLFLRVELHSRTPWYALSSLNIPCPLFSISHPCAHPSIPLLRPEHLKAVLAEWWTKSETSFFFLKQFQKCTLYSREYKSFIYFWKQCQNVNQLRY